MVCMGEYNHSFRGVLVYMAQKADIHQQLGFYTEHGMVYATAYGARKSSNLHKRTLSVFTMGKVFVTKKKNNTYTFKDIDVYRNGEYLGYSLLLYYTACVCVELVRYVVGADHRAQFKLLVDVLLYLIDSNDAYWKESLAFFLWQSLSNNGWQPDVSTIAIEPHGNDTQRWLLYHSGKIVPLLHNNVPLFDKEKCILSASLVSVLQTVSQLRTPPLETHRETNSAIEMFSCIDSQLLSQFVHFLLHQWVQLLGRKLISVSFLQKYL